MIPNNLAHSLPIDALKNLHIVLVRAENPANIGQAARAMKNFAVSHLDLVQCGPHMSPDALTLGWHAKDILEQASLFDHLSQATNESSLIVGFTSRAGRHRGVPRELSNVVPLVSEMLRSGSKVSFVFGNEKNGLSNEEIDSCHELAVIPASSEYSSLNLSHAVCVACYSAFLPFSKPFYSSVKEERFFATPEETEALMHRFSEMLELLDYCDGEHKLVLTRTMENLRRFFQKTGLEKRELHLFQALLANIKKGVTDRDSIKAG